MSGLEILQARLDAWESQGLLREPPAPRAADDVDFGSNDYLGIGAEADTTAYGSRLLTGDHRAHTALESALATWVHAEAALTFASGYAANVGVLSSLPQPGDVVVSDALNHASLVDGCRLSRADIHVVPHLDLDAVRLALKDRPARNALQREAAAFVVTETYFSMDADTPDLRALSTLCQEHGAALVVDEAHALGVFGKRGAGLCAAANVRPDVLVGTFGKSFGVSGAFVAGAAVLRSWLWNRARSFVFSTGITPILATKVLEHLPLVQAADERRENLHARTLQFRTGLKSLGIEALGHGPIVPWVVGSTDRALRIAGALRSRGVRVHAVRPPTVPANACRIRFALHAGLSESLVHRALDAVKAVV